jgi:hypothetical protein
MNAMEGQVVPVEELNALIKKWEARASDFRSHAEEAFFAKGGDLPDESLKDWRFHEERERHMEACCRFTEYCIHELKEVLKRP